MNSQLVLAFCFVAGVQALAQAAAAPPQGLPKDPRAILAAAAPFYDSSDPALKPFHIKATYQLYDENGKPEEKGTWEYWHISSKEYRSSWARADAARTEWRTADGALYRKESGKTLKYFERNIANSVLSPLPTKEMLDSGRYSLEVQSVPAGRDTLPCVLATLQWFVNGQPSAPSSSVGERYCFDPASHALLISVSNTIGTEYREIVKTQNHYIPREVDFFAGNIKLFALSVDMIDGVSEADAAATPAADAVLESPAPAITVYGGKDPAAGVAVGRLVKKVAPVYPDVAKMARVQGEVVLAAVISKEGRIKDLEVLATPSPMLTAPALDAVKRWEYLPYLLNGEPVEVETIINVNFALGR
jgi:TonB family protein